MFGFSRSLKMKTLNFIKRKCRGLLAGPNQALARLLVERFGPSLTVWQKCCPF